MFADLANIFLIDATASDIELQITKNSETLRLRQKHSAQTIADIHEKYKPEKEAIRNEISNLDDKSANGEYQDLMAELNELKDKEEREVEQEEQIASDYENKITIQNDLLQAQLEDLKANREGTKQCLDDSIERNFSYAKS